MAESERWPASGDSSTDSTACFRCGYEYSSDPAMKEEEVGHKAINGSLCYSCTINDVAAFPSVFAVRAAHDFQVTRFENTVWDTPSHQPVSTPRCFSDLTERERSLVESIATRTLRDDFDAIPRSDLSEEKVNAAAPVFESPLEDADEIATLPGLAIIGMDVVFTESECRDRVKQRLSDPKMKTEQTGIAQF